MRAYSSNMNASRRRIKKVHSKARLVGLLYLLGTIGLAVLAFLPNLNVQFNGKDEGVSIFNFTKGFSNGLGAELLATVIYLILILVLVINLFRSLSKVKRVMKRNSRNINACNRNLSAMEDMGDIFSCSFATTVIMQLVIYLILPGPQAKDLGALSLMGFITLAVGVVIHFLGGTIGGTASIFLVGMTVEEKKRNGNIFVFLLRNFLQVAVVAAIIYLVAPITTLYVYIPKILSGDMAALTGDIMVLIAFVLQLLVFVFLAFCIKHATASTEYNLMGMDGFGMHNHAIFVILAGVVAIVAFFLDKQEGEMILNYLFAGAIAIVSFVLDLIIKPKESEEESKEWRDIRQGVKPIQQQMPQQQPQQRAMAGCPMMMGCPAMRGCGAPMTARSCVSLSEEERRRLQQQGVIIKESKDDLARARKQVKINGRTAGQNQKDAMQLAVEERRFADGLSDYSVAEDVVEDDSIQVKLSLPRELFTRSIHTKSPVPVGIPEGLPEGLPYGLPEGYKGVPNGMPPKEGEKKVCKCPACGKELTVKGAPYHRCPACGKVFQIKEKEVPVVLPPETPEQKKQRLKEEKKAQKAVKAAEKKAIRSEKKAEKKAEKEAQAAVKVA